VSLAPRSVVSDRHRQVDVSRWLNLGVDRATARRIVVFAPLAAARFA
jgi:hypothetical protein